MKKKVWIIIILTIIFIAFITFASLFFRRVGDCKTDCPMSCIGSDEDCKNYCDCLCSDTVLGTNRENFCSSQANLPNQMCVHRYSRDCVLEQNKTSEACEVYSLCICRDVEITNLTEIRPAFEGLEERHDECIKEAGINIPYSPSWK